MTVTIRVLSRGALFKESLSMRPVRILPTGNAGVVYKKLVYPLYEGDFIDLSDPGTSPDKCPFISDGRAIPYVPSTKPAAPPSVTSKSDALKDQVPKEPVRAAQIISKHPGGNLYVRWNSVIAEVVYPRRQDVVPVYLDLDADRRSEVASRLQFSVERFDLELADAVKGFLNISTRRREALFGRVNKSLTLWKRDPTPRDAPPVLPLLALLTAAAEKMACGDGMSDNNFYGRVSELLDIPDDFKRFVAGYRKHGEGYWAVLARWLEENDGLRGLPTAAAVGHRYVGLPISQVLVREADREKFPAFFTRAGFPPGATVPPGALKDSFDDWISSEPCPVSTHLERNWRIASAQNHILSVAAALLAAWDGRLESRHADNSTALVSLALNLSSFPKRRIEFSPVVYLSGPTTSRDGEILTTEGWEDIKIFPFSPGVMRIGQANSLDNRSLLEGLLEIRDPATGRHLKRTPRPLIVFRREALAAAYLETDQIMLGDDLFVVVRDQPKLVSKLEEIFRSCAREGWRELPDTFGGFPDGWRVYRDVELFCSPAESVGQDLDLHALVPLSNSQLAVAGGFSLPGRIRGKWHRDRLPELRAVTDDSRGMSLRLLDFGTDDKPTSDFNELSRLDSDGPGPLVMDLMDEELDDGLYRIELIPHSSKGAVSSITIRVCSGDEVDEEQREITGAADQFLDDPLSVIGASDTRGDRTVAGALLNGCVTKPPLKSFPIRAREHWRTSRSMREKPTVSIQTVPPESCIYSGAHHTNIEQVPLDSKGRAAKPYVTGKCTKCGLQREFPSSHWGAKKSEKSAASVPIVSSGPGGLVPVVFGDSSPAWDVVLDAIFNVGAGTMKTFERLAFQIEPSALMTDHLARTLFALGYIDLLRNPETLELEAWDISPSCLVPTERGWFLGGCWNRGLRSQLSKMNSGVRLSRVDNAEAPGSWYLAEPCNSVPEGVDVVEPAINIAVQLPPLSAVLEALPRVPAALRVEGLTAFDAVSGKWCASAGMNRMGGYRIRHFSTDDVLRTQADLDNRTMARSTVHLSKHATAMLWGRKPLLAYDPKEKTLKVPLGANLPGLYERAVVLASGLAPRKNEGSLEYVDVPANVAGHIAYLLTH